MPRSLGGVLRSAAAISALAAAPAAASAQDAASPYASYRDRPIKALSQAQVDDLLAGGGMGLALTAELNGLPGPLHAIELADSLGLSAAQRERVARIRARMLDAATELGRRIVEAEAAFDENVRERRLRPAELEAHASVLGGMWGRLRAIHLTAHFEMMDVLSPAQVARYQELRGYHGADGDDTQPAPATPTHQHSPDHAHP